MFGNFLYFIVALLIYTTYQPTAEPQLPFHQAALFFSALSLLFIAVTRLLFGRLEKRMDRIDGRHLEQEYHSLLTRQSVMALVVFALDIYLIELGSYSNRLPVFTLFPTIEALLFLCIFIAYLSAVWASAYPVYEALYKTGISRRQYVLSNISFAVPVLLPWFCLSVIADIISALPYEGPEAFLMSMEGQILYFLTFLFIIAIIGPALIQRFWGCRPLKPGYDRIRIEHICSKAALSYKDIMLWPLFGGKMMTAGVMGLIRRFRYILVTPALLRYLEPVEIDAVVAHEIGHVKQKHLVFYLFFFVGYLVFAFSALDLITYGIMYSSAVFGWFGSEVSGQTTSLSIVFSIAMITIFFVYFRYIFGYFMRNFERQADIYVYNLLSSAQPLISTLNKIAASSGQSPDKPNWHHFSISERVDYLDRCEKDRSWIARHHRKIRFSIIVYLAGLVLTGWGGYKLHYGSTGQALSSGIYTKLIRQQIQENPGNPDLYLLLGDLSQSTGKLSEAISAYESALSLNPDDPRALNNLAWLYATAEKPNFYHPEKALALARRAVGISRQPHILDTLAESYFTNNLHRQAVDAAEEALNRARENRGYYREQLEKFQRAAAGEKG